MHANTNCSVGVVALPLVGAALWSDTCLLGQPCPLECKILWLVAAVVGLALLVATLVRAIRLCCGHDRTPPYVPIYDAAVAKQGLARPKGEGQPATFVFEKTL